jgi:hypothetical protein
VATVKRTAWTVASADDDFAGSSLSQGTGGKSYSREGMPQT